YELAEKIGDVAQMAADLQTKGTILLEMGRADEAKALFDKALEMTQDSNLSKQIKDNANLFNHFNLPKVAIAKKDLTTAKNQAEEYRKGAEAAKNAFQIKQAHELMGSIAMEEKDYDKAIAEFRDANQQNPYDLYRLCQAYQGKGDSEKAKDTCTKAA